MDIDGELTLYCESGEGRKMEEYFRRILFRWKYFQVDMVVEDTYYIPTPVPARQTPDEPNKNPAFGLLNRVCP
jgi:hypothetical protein